MSFRIQQLLIILLVMFVAFYLQELSGSNVLQRILPEWPFIFMLYFSVSNRYFFSVISAFIVGLVQDVFLGTPLGLNAAIYVFCCFFIIQLRIHFKHTAILTQSLFIAGFVLFKVLVIFVYNSIVFSLPSHYWVYLSVPFSVLVWPLIHFLFSFFASRHA